MARTTTVHYLDINDAAKELGVGRAEAQAALASGQWQPYGRHRYKISRVPSNDSSRIERGITLVGEIEYFTQTAA